MKCYGRNSFGFCTISDHRGINLSEDKPVPWAEITAPTTAKDCQKCGLALQRARVIRGEGNPGEPVMILLDNPGAREKRL